MHEITSSQVLPPGAVERSSLSDLGSRGNSTRRKQGPISSIEWGYLFGVELCPHPLILMLIILSQVSQNVTLFGDRVFAEVIKLE